MSGPLKIGENFATTLYGRQKPQSLCCRLHLKALIREKLPKTKFHKYAFHKNREKS